MDSPLPIIAQETPRGFTDHEHLDQLGLVNMNGRIYDPAIGRFLSADPFIQYPESTQGLNRYTYVNNNPLSFTDPTGYFSFSFGSILTFALFDPATADTMTGATPLGQKIGHVIGEVLKNDVARTVVTIIATYYGGPGGAAGVVAAYNRHVQGGSLSDMYKTGAVALASYSGFGRFSGSSSQGSGWSSAISASVDAAFRRGPFSGPQAESPQKRSNEVVSNAIAEATVAGSGGKFANGAISAAFAQMFSEMPAAANNESYGMTDEEWQQYVIDTSPRTADLWEFPQPVVDAVAGFGDTFGAGYIRDWLGIDGGVNYDSSYYSGGQVAGFFTPGMGTAASLRVAAHMGRSYRWLNPGRYWRIGPGIISKAAGAKPFNYGAGRYIPMLRIGNGKPSSLTHFDLRVLGR